MSESESSRIAAADLSHNPGLVPLDQRLIHTAERVLGASALSPDQVHERLRAIDPDQFMQVLDYINYEVQGGVERADHSSTTSVLSSEIDGKEVVSVVLLAPDYRAGFTEYVLEKAKAADTAANVANAVAYGTVLAHAFLDGNGRTARVASLMAYNGYDKSDPASMLALSQAAAEREQGADRKPSFAPNLELRRSWVCGQVDQAGQLDRYKTIKFVKNMFTSETDSGIEYTDPEKIEQHLSGIHDDRKKTDVRRRIQQLDFGDLVLLDIVGDDSDLTADQVTAALAGLNDTDADRIVAIDNERKFTYSKVVVDVAAGGAVPYYDYMHNKVDGYNVDQSSLPLRYE